MSHTGSLRGPLTAAGPLIVGTVGSIFRITSLAPWPPILDPKVPTPTTFMAASTGLAARPMPVPIRARRHSSLQLPHLPFPSTHRLVRHLNAILGSTAGGAPDRGGLGAVIHPCRQAGPELFHPGISPLFSALCGRSDRRTSRLSCVGKDVDFWVDGIPKAICLTVSSA